MSTEFNTAEELPVESQEEKGEGWRQEMQTRLQQYRERRERNGWGGESAPAAPSRVIPFRRPRPARSMEWAIPEPTGQPECIPPGLMQRVPASAPEAAAPAPVGTPADVEAPPPIVRTTAAEVANAGSETTIPAATTPEEYLASSMPAASPVDATAPVRPRVRKPIVPAETGVAEPVVRPRERRVQTAPPIQRSEQTRIRIELNSRVEEPEEPRLDLPLPVAPRRLRFNAFVNDVFYVLAGAGLFAAAVVTRTGLPRQMPDFQAMKRLLPAFVGVPGLLFALYVLLSFTFSDGTPGMKQAGLEVRNFNGKRASRRALRRRGWAMTLSLAACGIGLMWAGCDSDGLTLHDHISSTFLTVRRQRSVRKPSAPKPSWPAATSAGAGAQRRAVQRSVQP